MLYQRRGCAECANTGYRGRLGVFELMPASTQIKQVIINGASATQLLTVALEQGMETLKQDGIHKVLAGTTDLAQVLAVCER